MIHVHSHEHAKVTITNLATLFESIKLKINAHISIKVMAETNIWDNLLVATVPPALCLLLSKYRILLYI